ncbi:MAG: oligosaccharide flippase family protein [Bacilli bacterium]|nr:oligosaccharide flippase family protein [Bacilli bacterium]
MRKNKFITSTLILMAGGAITRFLGFIIKIMYTRIIGETGVSLYAIVMPTYSLLITIASLSLPISISKIVAEQKVKSSKILLSSTFIILLLNIILISIMLLTSKYIATNLLNNPDCYYLLIAMTLTLPFISISSILKGYFFGRQRMIPNTISNIIEQVVKIFLILFLLPILIQKSVFLAVMGLILFNIVTEIVSITTFCFFAPKKFTIQKKDFKPNRKTIKEIFSISLPTVSSRFIGNIGFFLEPIILTNILLSCGFSNEYILREYGAYNAYTIALLTMPSFFVGAVCSALIPEISKYQSQNNYPMIKRRFWQAMTFSFLIGLFFSSIIFFYRTPLLKIIYNTVLGVEYLKILAPFFVLFYLEAPLMSMLQALGASKETMKITLIGEIVKLSALTIFSFCKLGIYSLVYAEIINIILVVFLNIKKVKKYVFST